MKYPVGSKIKWFDEEYEVIENFDDVRGTVKQGDVVIKNFYFVFQGIEVIAVEY